MITSSVETKPLSTAIKAALSAAHNVGYAEAVLNIARDTDNEADAQRQVTAMKRNEMDSLRTLIAELVKQGLRP